MKRSLLIAALLSASVFAQPTKLRFRASATPAPIGTPVIAAGDVNRDTFPDLLATRGLFLNDGHAHFRELPRPGLLDYSSPESTAFVDLDGDGDRDLIAAGLFSSAPSIFVNDGSGGLRPSAAALPAIPLPPGPLVLSMEVRSLAVADVDLDGDPDLLLGLAVVCGAHGQARCATPQALWLNNGAGVFTNATAQLPAALSLATRQVVTADFDQDGDPDFLLVSMLPGPSVFLLLNNGAGTFTLGTAPNVPFVLQAAVGNFDGNPFPDLAFATNTGPDLVVLGGPTGFSASIAAPQAAGAQRVATLDVDGDGTDELLHGGTGSTQLFDVTTSGLGAAPIQTFSTLIFGGVVADLDGDGDADAIAAGNATEVLLNDGAGALHRYRQPAADAPITHAGALGDVDADGDIDLLAELPSPSGTQLTWLSNDGHGTFDTVGPIVPLLPSGSYISHYFDADGDGDVDLYRASAIYATYGGSSNDQYWENQAGTYTLMSTVTVTTDGYGVTDGDLDGDGDPDLVVTRRLPFTSTAGFYGTRSAVVLNLGGGAWSSPQLLPGNHVGRAAALLDADGDGDLDIMLAAGFVQPNTITGPGTSVLYTNDGTGTFTSSLFQSDSAVSVAAGDFDGDGDDDVVLDENVYFQTAQGFSPGPTLPAVLAIPSYWHGKAAADVNGDGSVDLVASNGTTYLNDGTGAFSIEQVGRYINTFVSDTRPHLENLDSDGDIDLLPGGSVHPLWNTSRHLFTPAPPRLGRPARLEIHGPAGSPYFLFVSDTTASISLPPYGTVFLNPHNVLLATTGTLDVAGQAHLQTLVPSNPAIVGLDLVWQAWPALSPRFTDRVVTTIVSW